MIPLFHPTIWRRFGWFGGAPCRQRRQKPAGPPRIAEPQRLSGPGNGGAPRVRVLCRPGSALSHLDATIVRTVTGATFLETIPVRVAVLLSSSSLGRTGTSWQPPRSVARSPPRSCVFPSCQCAHCRFNPSGLKSLILSGIENSDRSVFWF